MSRFRIPLERTGDASESLGWSAQVSGLAAVTLFLFLAGGGAFLATHASAGLKAKALAKAPDRAARTVSSEALHAGAGKGEALHAGAGKGEALHAGAGKGEALLSAEALRADFVGALARVLLAAGSDVAADAPAGVLRLGPGSVSFKVGQAWLIGRPNEEIDRVGKVLEQAIACLPKANAQAAPFVLDAELATRGGDACLSEEALADLTFQCKPEYVGLALEAVLVEGHADARPYAQPGRIFRDNLNLASARGENVMRRLYACSPGLATLANAKGQPLVGVASHSTQRPVPDAEPHAESNRRVEFRFLLGAAGKANPAPYPATQVTETDAVMGEGEGKTPVPAAGE